MINDEPTDEQRRSALKLLSRTMLELMLLDHDNVNSPQVTQWIQEELQERRRS